jgi:hypothetical protein
VGILFGVTGAPKTLIRLVSYYVRLRFSTFKEGNTPIIFRKYHHYNYNFRGQNKLLLILFCHRGSDEILNLNPNKTSNLIISTLSTELKFMNDLSSWFVLPIGKHRDRILSHELFTREGPINIFTVQNKIAIAIKIIGDKVHMRISPLINMRLLEKLEFPLICK